MADLFASEDVAAFLGAIEGMWNGLGLGDACAMLRESANGDRLTAAGLEIVSELLHIFRHLVGSRSAEWWVR